MGRARITFRPIDTWPGPLVSGRRPDRFRATRAQTMRLLAEEAGRLGAQFVVVQLALEESDFRVDGEPKALAAFQHPGVVVSFEGRYGPLAYRADDFDTWIGNLRAIALGLEALRAVDRYGISRSGEQYRGYRQIAAAAAPSVERGRALIAQHGGDFRQALKATHPDQGGNPDDLADVIAARRAGVT